MNEEIVAWLAGGAGRSEVGVTGVQLSSKVSVEGATGESEQLDAQVLRDDVELPREGGT